DALDFAPAQSLTAQPVAQTVHIRRLSEAHIHVGATPEIDSILDSALEEDGPPSDGQQGTAQGEEILGLAHPIQIGLLKELDHSVLRFPSLDSTMTLFVPTTHQRL